MRYVLGIFWLLAWIQCCECWTPGKGKRSNEIQELFNELNVYRCDT